MTKKLGILLLLVLGLIVLCFSSAIAETRSGSCGENVFWTLDEEGLLTISGTGKMDDFNFFPDNKPWGKTPIEVVVEKGVLTIGNYAFYGCDNLKSVTLSEGLLEIGYEAFFECDSLTSIDIPEGLIKIAKFAFAYCDSLSNITIPKSVTALEEAFNGCKNIASFYVDPENACRCTGIDLAVRTVGHVNESYGIKPFEFVRIQLFHSACL